MHRASHPCMEPVGRRHLRMEETVKRERKEGGRRGWEAGNGRKARHDKFIWLRDEASQPVNATNPWRNLLCTPYTECTGVTLHEPDLV